MLWQRLTQKNQNDLQLEHTTTHWGFGEGKKKEEDWQQMLAQGESSKKNSVVFLYTNNEFSEKEIRN